MGWRRWLQPRNEPRDVHHVSVEMTFRDAATEERHNEQDLAEMQDRIGILAAKVAALEMGDRDRDA